jgi:hypothetical protein
VWIECVHICICAYIREDMTDEYTLKILNSTKRVDHLVSLRSHIRLL